MTRKSLWQQDKEHFRKNNPLNWKLAVEEYVQGSHYRTYYTRRECIEYLYMNHIDKNLHRELLQYRLRVKCSHNVVALSLTELDRSSDANEPGHYRADSWARLKSAKAEQLDIRDAISNIACPNVTQLEPTQIPLFGISA